MSRRRRVLVEIAACGLLVGAALSVTAPAAHAITAHEVVVSPSGTPAFTPPASCSTGAPAYNFPGSGDAADPQIVYSDGTYYAFTTGNAMGNRIAALVSSAPDSGYGPYTGGCFGSTALPNPSGWEQPDTQTSPGVFQYGGHWVMFYDAAQGGHAGDTGFNCLAVATAQSISPTHVQFADVSGTPLLCQPTGSIDPQPFVDPRTGSAYLVWKQNDGGSSLAAYIWSQQLSSTGTGFAPGSHPSLLLYNDTVDYPWETTVENPAMAAVDGGFYLVFSAGLYNTGNYSEAITTCSSPVGPCGPQSQILTGYGSVLGPGGGALFSDAAGNWWLDYEGWQQGTPDCSDYSCGAARRLFVAPVSLPSLGASCAVPATPGGYRTVASDGGIFTFGNLPFCGSEGGAPLNRPIVGMAPTSDGGGYWLVASDGGVFTFGDAGFFGSTGAIRLNRPIVGLAPTPDGGGYWLVASDGGVFTFGDARFYGSAGALPLNRPIAGMAVTPDGAGYWLVATDGGIFSYGDAAFFGSTGARTLNAPIVGLAPTPDAGGYWLVASDGGIFSYGDASFHGSTGALHLNRPIVGMAATPDGGGYWLVATDGGIFAFGDAPYEGSTGNLVLNAPVVGLAASYG
jgi:hypothetical protein